MNLVGAIKRSLKSNTVAQRYYYGKKYAEMQERYSNLKDDEQPKRLLVCTTKRNKVDQLKEAFDNITIILRDNTRFQTWIDVGLVVTGSGKQIDNVGVNYQVVLDNSIEELVEIYRSSSDSTFSNDIVDLLNSIKGYIMRILDVIDTKLINEGSDNQYLPTTKIYFERMMDCKAETLEEALQRILFWSSLFWQTGHRLMGLGRLDKTLQRYISENESEQVSEETVELIKDFLCELHRYYPFKSNSVSMGDTGQIIILGGLDPDGSYFYNSLTYAFIKAVETVRLPDPKLLLRVAKNTPEELLNSAIACVGTGIGCPLLSNDDIVIPALVEFGYSTEDAHDYVTSACWEPLSFGKSFEQNNITDINFAAALINAINDRRAENTTTYADFERIYIEHLNNEVLSVLHYLNGITWDPNPLLSIFTLDCLSSGKTLESGGARYNNYGVLTVGLSNTVNSLINIKKYVFDEKRWSISQVKDIQVKNYSGVENCSIFSDEGHFGRDENESVEMVKRLTQVVYDACRGYVNPLGGKLKWGLSSSNYAEVGKNTGATLDGRHAEEPLGVHISAAKGEPFTELVSFASKLDYSGTRSNGNVLDFFVSPNLINDNADKFATFIRASINLGFFQMQMNVVSSETLKDALAHPEKHTDLIVRVWGFSAYFNDLPEYYKLVLIERAEQSELCA